MESYNSPQVNDLDPAFNAYFNEFQENLNKKFEIFNKKLENKKLQLENEFKSQLIEASTMNAEIGNTKNKLESTSPCVKSKLAEEAKFLRSKIELLINKMEYIENLAKEVKVKPMCEILKIDNDDFVLANSKIVEDNVKESPANSFKSNECRQCKLTLSWGESYLSKKCGFSNNCNTHYKYGCKSCNLSYCTNCAFPPDVYNCGCGKIMIYTSAPYHNCDLCRNQIISNCWRCSSCDFDICDTCYAKFKK
jgi:hypothetical protein